jgi:hypothetical protein
MRHMTPCARASAAPTPKDNTDEWGIKPRQDHAGGDDLESLPDQADARPPKTALRQDAESHIA